VNNEIALVLKMASSPLIKRHFLNPGDKKLEQEALDEIAEYRLALMGKSLFWVKDSDKKFYFDSTYAYTVSPEDPKDYWYEMTLLETPKYNFNINYNPDLKNLNLWINAPVFDSKRKIDREPKATGIIGTSVNLTSFISSIYKNYSGTANLYFFNAFGEITGAGDTMLAANKVSLEEYLGDLGVEINTRAKTIYPGIMQTFVVKDDVIAIGMVPALGWYITAIQPFELKDYLNSDITMIFFAIMLFIAFIFMILNVAIGYLLRSSRYL